MTCHSFKIACRNITNRLSNDMFLFFCFSHFLLSFCSYLFFFLSGLASLVLGLVFAWPMMEFNLNLNHRSCLKPDEHRWASSRWMIRSWSFYFISWRLSWPSSPSSNHRLPGRPHSRAVWLRSCSSTYSAIDPVPTACCSSALSRTVSPINLCLHSFFKFSTPSTSYVKADVGLARVPVELSWLPPTKVSLSRVRGWSII